MSDTERPRDHRKRDARPDHRPDTTDRTDRPDRAPRRNRSRSPRDRPARREGTRYRSRSPLRRDDRDTRRGGRDRPDRGGARVHRAPGPRTGPHAHAPSPAAPTPAATHTPAPTTAEPDTDTHMTSAPSRPDAMDDATWEVVSTMGFGGFKTTKNTKVPGNDRNYGVRRDKTMEARQYMNRQGGFNRPLSPGRS